MGGGCVCDNYLQKCCQNPNQNQNLLESKLSLEEYQDNVPQNNCNYNQITNKTTNILYNILENNQANKKKSKRYSDFNSNNLRYSNFKKKKMKNDIMEVPNSTLEEASYLNNPNNNNNNNEDTNINKKLITSNLNSSNLNESTLFPPNNINNTNIIHDNRYRHNNLTKIINDKNRSIAKQSSETLINYNMGENNFIFINIHRGKSFMNTNKMEKMESVTPKMIMEKGNFENITNGPKNLFSHIMNTRMNNYNNNSNQQFDCNTNRLSILDMNKYSEEMLNIINSIRTNPESFIKEIDYIINNNIKKTEEGIFLISHEVDEKIKLMDNYKEIFTKTKKELKNIANSKEKRLKLQNIIYNDNLEIILDESCLVDENNDLDESSGTDDIQNIPAKLNLIYDDDDAIDYGIEEEEIKSYNLNIIDFDSDNEKEESPNNKKNSRENKKIMNIKNNNIKNRHISYKKKKSKKKRNINNYLNLDDDQIANLILQKRKEVLYEYPHNVFKFSVIKDIKISILIELAMEEMFKGKGKTTLKEIIFNPIYKHFAVSWTNEINRNFISISCFA